jgi:(2Fe-2S) ferredoxin
MIQRPVPFQRIVFVCTHARPDGHPKPSCGLRGGADIREKLKLMVEEKGLQQAVKIFQSGCQGGCEFGPVLMTVSDQKMYFQVDENNLEELLAEVVRDLPEQPGLL